MTGVSGISSPRAVSKNRAEQGRRRYFVRVRYFSNRAQVAGEIAVRFPRPFDLHNVKEPARRPDIAQYGVCAHAPDL